MLFAKKAASPSAAPDVVDIALGIAPVATEGVSTKRTPACRHAAACDEYVGPMTAAVAASSASARSAYGINRNTDSEPAAAATRPASATPNARPAAASSARVSSSIGNLPRASALANGAGY